MSFGPEMLIDSGSFRAAEVNGDELPNLAGPVESVGNQLTCWSDCPLTLLSE